VPSAPYYKDVRSPRSLILLLSPCLALLSACNRGAHPAQLNIPAPDFTVSDGTNSIHLASYRGKVVLLNFWASWCEPCQVEAPLLQRSEHALEAHDGTVLGVTYLDASPDSEAFVRKYHLSYTNLRDNDNGDFAHAYGTDKLPESFIIDRQGRIVAISRGEIDQSFIDKALALARST
jgi:cytochrome c biogenesis protein CcmG, thiol:disulfide interchange protein DsbE